MSDDMTLRGTGPTRSSFVSVSLVSPREPEPEYETEMVECQGLDETNHRQTFPPEDPVRKSNGTGCLKSSGKYLLHHFPR